MKPPKVIYRYMTAEHALLLIRDRLLKVTPPIQFNDVYELTPRASRRCDKRFGEIILSDKGARTTLANTLNRALNVSFKQEDLERFSEKNPRLWNKIIKLYYYAKMSEFAFDFVRIVSVWHGVACFTENPKNRVMWAHYADKFSGVVVGFNTGNAFFQKLPLKKVVYGNRRIRFRKQFDKKIPHREIRRRYFISMISDSDPLLLTKHFDFRHEKEWRFIALLANCRKRKNKLFFRRLPLNCISEIIFGPRCDPRLKNRIMNLANKIIPKTKINTLDLDLEGFGFAIKNQKAY